MNQNNNMNNNNGYAGIAAIAGLVSLGSVALIAIFSPENLIVAPWIVGAMAFMALGLGYLSNKRSGD